MGQVTAHPEAVAELRAAIIFYDDKSPGLGRRFFEQIDQMVERISAQPLFFSPRGGEVRRANLKRFPFHILYLTDDESVAIVAFAHDRRRPVYWKHRLPPAGQAASWPPFPA